MHTCLPIGYGNRYKHLNVVLPHMHRYKYKYLDKYMYVYRHKYTSSIWAIYWSLYEWYMGQYVDWMICIVVYR